jgi:hypothetical protein
MGIMKGKPFNLNKADEDSEIDNLT